MVREGLGWPWLWPVKLRNSGSSGRESLSRCDNLEAQSRRVGLALEARGQVVPLSGVSGFRTPAICEGM